MNVLLSDTSTETLSIALSTDTSYEERLVSGAFRHSEDLLPEIEALLSRAGITMKDLDLLITAKGPGSFTGLRIGMASMKGISSALSIPLVSVPTLDATAEAVSFYPGAVLSVIDAKKQRYYLSMKKGGCTIIPDTDGNTGDVIDAIRKEDMPTLITGPDAAAFAQRLLEEDSSIRILVDGEAPRNLSKAFLALGRRKFMEEGADDPGEGPVYIRRSDAEEALERRMKERKDGV